MRRHPQYYIQLLLITAIAIIINMLASGYFFRVDLTEEKRFTLSPLSKKTAEDLDAIMTVQVYLEGEFQPRIKRFRDAIKTTLLELKVYAGSNLDYQFIDPTGNNDLAAYLSEKGVTPVEVKYRGTNGEISSKWIFPAAILNYRGQEVVVNLLEGNCMLSRQGSVCDYSKAEEELEYKLVSGMRRMFREERRIVGLLKGQKELKRENMKEFITELEKFYNVIDVEIKDGKAIPPSIRFLPDSIKTKFKNKGQGIEVLIVAQPDSTFTDREKYELDQYIMLGGRVLWLCDNVTLDEQDFQTETGSTMTQKRRMNLDDLFFQYGFRLKSAIVQDDIAGNMPVTVEYEGKRMIIPQKWVYFPMVLDFKPHPAARNLNSVLMRYASPIETLKVSGITHKVILQSSPYSRSLDNPTVIDLPRTIGQPPPRSIYKGKGNLILGLSAEGKFKSAFEGRAVPVDSNNRSKPTARFISESAFPTKMIILGDGSIALPNHMGRLEPPDMPVNNKQLLMNCIEYLMDEDALTEIRSKQAIIRRLDPKAVLGNEWKIQAFNILAPIALALVIGFTRLYLRRRKYGKK